MAINFKTAPDKELLQELQQIEGKLTVCRRLSRAHSNAIYIKIPITFPEYDKLSPTSPIYFIEEDGSLFISVQPPEHHNYKIRRIAWSCRINNLKVAIPYLYIKKHRLKDFKELHLIQKGDRYVCSWIS